MIPATHPYNAVYRHDTGVKNPNGTTCWTATRQPVIAWNNAGEALVAHGHRLVPAVDLDDFHSLEENGDAIVAALPGGGWRVAYQDETEHHDPVLVWLVRADGSVTPVDVDPNGDTGNPTAMDNFAQLIQPGA